MAETRSRKGQGNLIVENDFLQIRVIVGRVGWVFQETSSELLRRTFSFMLVVVEVLFYRVQ